MKYAEAAAIVAEHTPNLILSPEIEGQRHIDVRKTEAGAPFSIMLPVIQPADDTVKPDDVAAAERKELTDALDSASKHLVA